MVRISITTWYSGISNGEITLWDNYPPYVFVEYVD